MSQKIIRVFPRKTSMTPTDSLAFVGDPPLFRPGADEVHVSVTFTWDIEEGRRLANAWAQYYPVVKIGGPAIDGSTGEFVPGRYVKSGVTFTSRGCPNRCPWCLVPKHEGSLRLLDVKPGWIIQDNNFLATPRSHQKRTYEMLKTQSRGAIFYGGLDTTLVDGWVADQLRQLRISAVFLAADTMAAIKTLREAVEKLEFLGLNSNKLRCYALIGYNGETVKEARGRLKTVWDVGCIPFAQLYQPADRYIEYSKKWKALARAWSRPAAMRAMHKQSSKAPKCAQMNLPCYEI